MRVENQGASAHTSPKRDTLVRELLSLLIRSFSLCCNDSEEEKKAAEGEVEHSAEEIQRITTCSQCQRARDQRLEEKQDLTK